MNMILQAISDYYSDGKLILKEGKLYDVEINQSIGGAMKTYINIIYIINGEDGRSHHFNIREKRFRELNISDIREIKLKELGL